jgi:hypothetical protein
MTVTATFAGGSKREVDRDPRLPITRRARVRVTVCP